MADPPATPASAGRPLPPPLPPVDLARRVTDMGASSNPTAKTVAEAKAGAAAWGGPDMTHLNIGLQDTSLKNIIARCFGRHNLCNWSVTLPPATDGATESKLQFEFATGTQEQQTAKVQKEKVLKWCADREQARIAMVTDLGRPSEQDLEDYPLSSEQLTKAMQESGCGTVRFPAEVGVMVHDQGDSGKCRSEKFRAGAAAVTQLLASTCVVLTARAEPAASAEGAQGTQGAQVDLRVLYRLLRCVPHSRLTRPPAHHHQAPFTYTCVRDRFLPGTRGGGTTESGGLTRGQRFKLILRLATIDASAFPAMFEASVRPEMDAGINKASTWTAFIAAVNESLLSAAEKTIVEKVQREAGSPLLGNSELAEAAMDAKVTAPMTAVKAAMMLDLKIIHDVADYIASPPASGLNDVDQVDAPWRVISYLYQSEGPSEVALFGFYVGEKGLCPNFIALSNYINTNAQV